MAPLRSATVIPDPESEFGVGVTAELLLGSSVALVSRGNKSRFVMAGTPCQGRKVLRLALESQKSGMPCGFASLCGDAGNEHGPSERV